MNVSISESAALPWNSPSSSVQPLTSISANDMEAQISPPRLLSHTLPSFIFFIALIVFGNDLVYVLTYFFFLCCFIDCNQNGVGGRSLTVLFASLAPVTVLGWWRILNVYLWNEWIYGLINGLMASLFSQPLWPPAPWWFLTRSSSSCAEFSHTFLCLWIFSLHPSPPSPSLFAFPPYPRKQLSAPEGRGSSSPFPPWDLAQGLGNNGSHWSCLYNVPSAFHMILVLRTWTSVLNSKQYIYYIIVLIYA